MRERMQGKQTIAKKKLLSIRPQALSQNLINYIDSQLRKNKDATVTGLIVELMQKGLNLSDTGEKHSLPTGAIIECPIRPTPIPICAWCDSCSNVVYMKAKVDSSVCKTCPKYPCETWEIILSEQRLSDKGLIKKTELQERIEKVHSLT